MSPGALPRRVHVSWLAPRDCEPPAGANRYIWLVGKQSTQSNRNTSRFISFLAELSSCLGVLRRLGSLPSRPQQGVYWRHFVGAGRIRSAELRLLRINRNAAAVQTISNSFNCNDVIRSICYKPLTRDCSGRNILLARGRSKRTALSKSPNGPVAGLSPENVES